MSRPWYFFGGVFCLLCALGAQVAWQSLPGCIVGGMSLWMALRPGRRWYHA